MTLTKAKNRRFYQRGFTMLEVMVSIGLLVVLILTISNAQSGAIFFSQYSKNLMTATNLARFKMTELEIMTRNKPLKELKSFKDSGKFKDYESFAFEMHIRPTKIKLPIPKEVIEGNPMMAKLNEYLEKDLFAEAVVTIRWGDKKDNRHITVREMFANWTYLKELTAMVGG